MKKTTCTPKKKANKYARMMAIICLFLFVGCKPLRMFTQTESATDTYCVYKITEIKNTTDRAALKIGDIICLYCTGSDVCLLKSKQWIKWYEVSSNPNLGNIFISKDLGISYYIELDAPSTTCTSCPSANKFELFK